MLLKRKMCGSQSFPTKISMKFKYEFPNKLKIKFPTSGIINMTKEKVF